MSSGSTTAVPESGPTFRTSTLGDQYSRLVADWVNAHAHGRLPVSVSDDFLHNIERHVNKLTRRFRALLLRVLRDPMYTPHAHRYARCIGVLEQSLLLDEMAARLTIS